MALVYATFSTWATPTVSIKRGDVWDDSDPVVTSHPDWFTDDPAAHGLVNRSGSTPRPPVAPTRSETTSAAPGEKRDVVKPAGKPGTPGR